MGYIDRTGKTIIEPKFDVAFDFVDGIAEVYFSEKVTSSAGPVTLTGRGYIDKGGRFIWRPISLRLRFDGNTFNTENRSNRTQALTITRQLLLPRANSRNIQRLERTRHQPVSC